MRVGERYFHWTEGGSHAFDDTNEHEVWNESDEERVVLMVQFRRPMRQPGRFVSHVFLEALRRTPYVTVSHRNQRAFEQRLAAVERLQHDDRCSEPRRASTLA